MTKKNVSATTAPTTSTPAKKNKGTANSTIAASIKEAGSPAKNPRIKKSAKKDSTKTTPAPRVSTTLDQRTKEVNRPQHRILIALAKSSTPLDDNLLAEKASVQRGWIVGYTFKSCGDNKTQSLVEQGLVKSKEIDMDGKKKRVYEINATGKKTLAKLDKEAEAKKKDK